MERNLIIGNAICFVGCVIASTAGLWQTKKRILIAQIAFASIFAVGFFVAGAYACVISNLFGVVLRVLAYKNKLGKGVKNILMLVFLVSNVLLIPFSFVNSMPIVAFAIYTYTITETDEDKFKIYNIFATIPYVIYDVANTMYVNVVFDSIAVIIYAVAILRSRGIENMSLLKKRN